jgi:endonuclease III
VAISPITLKQRNMQKKEIRMRSVPIEVFKELPHIAKQLHEKTDTGAIVKIILSYRHQVARMQQQQATINKLYSQVDKLEKSNKTGKKVLVQVAQLLQSTAKKAAGLAKKSK